MSPSPAATAGAICVLVADSNRMQAQLLTNALRRRSEFRLVVCGMDTASIHNAIASAPTQVALLSPNSSAGLTESMATIRQLHMDHPEIVKILLVESCPREMVISAFRSGAGNFLPQRSQPALAAQMYSQRGPRRGLGQC